MSRRIGARSAVTLVLTVLIATLGAGPVAVAGHGPLPATAAPLEHSADLAPTLGTDGTFHGVPGVAGSVDTSAWTLVSNLAAGEPPRFAPATSVSPSAAAAGPWSALGSNAGNGALNSDVFSLAVSGSDLYVGGYFTDTAGIPEADYIAKWDGSTWSALGSNGHGDGALNYSVDALAVSGTSLYVGGAFTNAGGIRQADRIAKWDGSAWSALGSNGSGDGAINSDVDALAVSGTDLYVGGYFTNAAGIPEADHVATWDGSAWSALGSNGSGDGAINNWVKALAVSGSDLYVGGYFTDTAGTPVADRIAKWDGSEWSALGSNGSGNGALNHWVDALAVSGTDLYVGGAFTNAAGIPEADYVAKWNGSAWSALGSDGSGNGALSDGVDALAVSGDDLYVGGGFTDAAGIPEADYVAKWNGSAWSALGSNGAGDGAISDDGLGYFPVDALAVSGDDLYVGGGFTDAAGIPEADYVATWDGSAWSALGSNGSGDGALQDAEVDALAVSGTDLYVGGYFTDAAGIPEADYIAKWNGSAWSALGSNGSGNGALQDADVRDLAVSGANLYVGGYFTDAAGIPEADYVAKWNGSAWSALGSNGSGNGAINWDCDYCVPSVDALAVSGADLYVGGYFTDAAGIPEADYVAAWDGSAWSAVGSNGSGDGAIEGNYSSVNALAVSGTNLYVGGGFTDAAGIPEADNIAMWNGSAWSAVGSNGSGNGAINGGVDALAVSGTDLYVGGGFTDAAGIPKADKIAKWNGSTWSGLGSNGHGDGALNYYVDALVVSGTDLYVGGAFTNAAGIPKADRVAKWDGSAWSALGSNGSGNGALNKPVYALSVSGDDLYVGGLFTDAAGIPQADYVAKWHTSGGVVRQPDARIRLGTGAYVGNNVYNTTGAGQKRSGSAKPGHSLSFGISVQNDGTVTDTFTVKATGTTVNGYRVKYFSGSTDITAAVVAGTYQTASLAPGAKVLITAKVTVKSAAARHSSLSRRVTLTSLGDTAKQDTVKLIVKRA